MKRGILTAVHSGYWGLYCLLLALVLAMSRGSHGDERPLAGLLIAWPILLIGIAPNAAAFYASYGPLFSRFMARRRFAGLFAGGLSVCIAASALGLLLALLIFGADQPVFSNHRELAAMAISFCVLAGIHSAIALVIRGFVGWYGDESLGARTTPPAVEAADEPARRPPAREFIFVKTEQRLERVRLDEILMIEGQRDYRRIHTTSRRIMTLQTFGEFERQIPPEVMCRVHKSYMVALDKIESIERGRITIQNLVVPISDTYRKTFFAIIGQSS